MIGETSASLPTTDPIVDPSTMVFRRACKDDDEAYQMAKKMRQDNQWRTDKAGAIQRQLNDPQPWKQKSLKDAGQDWRSNFCTGFQSSILKRVIPAFGQTIDQAVFLTMASLKQKDQESLQKDDSFRRETTAFLRRWEGWLDFKNQVVFENCAFGGEAVIYTDEWSWEPIYTRQDEIFFNEGCPQDIAKVPSFTYLQRFQIHELAAIVANPVAEDAGWNVKKVADSINQAKPENRRSGTQDEARKWQDTVRETSMAQSYADGVKVVETLHLFAQEANGLVSHYLFDAQGGKCLFKRLDQFESMLDLGVLFTLEHGNGKFYGSKGVGRQTYNIAISVEQTRNLSVDALKLQGMLVLKGKATGRTKAAITVLHPVCLISDGFEAVKDANFKMDADPFFALDRFLTNAAELQVGAYLSQGDVNTKGDKATASQVNYVASIEQQVRAGTMSRFWSQFMKAVYLMQRRIYNKDNIKTAMLLFQKETQAGKPLIPISEAAILNELGGNIPEALIWDDVNTLNKECVELCWRLMKLGLTASDLYRLAQCPANEAIMDPSQQNAQAINSLVAKYMGNPMIDQHELINLDVASTAGNDVAEKLVIPEDDPTVASEAVRMQLMELAPLLAGEDVPVSPRDQDMLHIGVIMSKKDQVLGSITPNMVNDFVLKAGRAVLGHLRAHIDSALAKGTEQTDPQMKEATEFAAQAEQLLGQAEQNLPNSSTNFNQSLGGVPMSPPPDAATNQFMPEEGNTLPSRPVPPDQGGMPLSRGPVNLNPTPM